MHTSQALVVSRRWASFDVRSMGDLVTLTAQEVADHAGEDGIITQRADGMIQKPFDLADLLAHVEQATAPISRT
jgi:hypothetical protein